MNIHEREQALAIHKAYLQAPSGTPWHIYEDHTGEAGYWDHDTQEFKRVSSLAQAMRECMERWPTPELQEALDTIRNTEITPEDLEAAKRFADAASGILGKST